MGEGILAMEFFRKMSNMAPESLEPLVYLSRLYLETREVEPCVVLCGRLLSLLDIEENRTLNSLAELGGLYYNVGKRLTLSPHNPDLGSICFEISDILGYRCPEVIPEMV
jgi:hypothetical protein